MHSNLTLRNGIRPRVLFRMNSGCAHPPQAYSKPTPQTPDIAPSWPWFGPDCIVLSSGRHLKAFAEGWHRSTEHPIIQRGRGKSKQIAGPVCYRERQGMLKYHTSCPVHIHIMGSEVDRDDARKGHAYAIVEDRCTTMVANWNAARSTRTRQ